jgi:hypothetical protein
MYMHISFCNLSLIWDWVKIAFLKMWDTKGLEQANRLMKALKCISYCNKM